MRNPIMNWTLQAISEELNGQNILIDHDMLVGRHQDCDIVLQSSLISRRHAAFYIKDNVLWLEDLNSSNGTFINDIKVEQPTALKNGEIIQFANLKFSLEASVQQEELSKQEIKQAEDINTTASIGNDEGMPSMEERAKDTQIDSNGVPTQVDIPKPAPLPNHVDLEAHPQPKPVATPQEQTEVSKEIEKQKNVSVGLITVIILAIIAVIAWFLFQ